MYMSLCLYHVNPVQDHIMESPGRWLPSTIPNSILILSVLSTKHRSQILRAPAESCLVCFNTALTTVLNIVLTSASGRTAAKRTHRQLRDVNNYSRTRPPATLARRAAWACIWQGKCDPALRGVRWGFSGMRDVKHGSRCMHGDDGLSKTLDHV